MAYSLAEAKKLIINAGLELTKQKLVARTWGNISARLSDTEFLITPSGIPYEKINEKNLVVVKIEDASWSGDVKPSGEKKVHAAIYKVRKDVNFIVHTHQNYATAISCDGLDKEFAPVAKYGLPSTKKLVKNIEKAVKDNLDKNAVLMERHGAIIYSSKAEDVFSKALDLEAKSKKYFEKYATKKSDKIERKPYLDDYAQMFGFGSKAVEEDKEAIKAIKEKNSLAASYLSKPKSMGLFDVLIQHLVYKKKYAKLAKKVK